MAAGSFAMSSSSSAPLPPLPLEVKGHVLRFCDPATLAITSRVSLAFLELSIPILHEDIHIKDFVHLGMLLCSRNAQALSAVDSLLSLSLVKTFKLVSDGPDEGRPLISLHRLVDRRTLAVDRLILGMRDQEHDIPDVRWSALFPLFDPKNVRIYSVEIGPVLIDLNPAPWSNLRSIEFCEASSFVYLGSADFFRQSSYAERPLPLKVIYDFAEEGWNPEVWDLILQDVFDGNPGRDMFGPSSRLAEVVVRVLTEDDKEEAVAMQTYYPMGLPESERKRRLALIQYEVVDPPVEPDPTAT